MADDEFHYDRMVQEALRSVVGKALIQVAERGLSGEHHLYITFRSDHPDVVMPDHLRARYPSEMTIVLQHQFWGLEVGPDSFGITLTFANVPERLTVPFEALVAFADPSVPFGLQFESGAGGQKPGEERLGEKSLGEEDQVVLGDAAPPEVEAANRKSGPDAAGEGRGGDKDSDKVVALDAFRKIDGLRKK